MSYTFLFRKMEEICMRMQNPETGIPLKTQKYFRIAVPSSFTGIELVEWLMHKLKIEDTTEALHLAEQLNQFGYLFPVFEATEGHVKDDNSLYRFQIPYFWPSHNANPENVEYAIFLCKRLMRNEERHGLSIYEVEAYNKLRELLGHMWDFIQTQAETQLKLFKEKKKVDKVVFDSQKRAFWRVHRPPPGFGNCFDEKYGKIEKKIKRRSARDYQNEMERLKFALKTKPWLKSPKAVETLVSWCEQFTDYDPFLSPLKDPGNPWINDDAKLWELNTDLVDVPTERRVRRWGFSIQELIRDQIGRQVLESFLESEFSQENIRFWIAVQDLKYSPASQVKQKLEAIYEEFLVSGAPCQVNVDSRTLDAVIKAMADKKLPPRYCFSQAEEHIFILMSKDSYPRFLRSEIYKGVLTAAQQQGSKKVSWRYYLFGNVTAIGGGGAKKLSVAPNPQALSRTSPLPTGKREDAATPRQLSAESAASWLPKKLSRGADSTDGLPHPVSTTSLVRMSDEKQLTQESSVEITFDDSQIKGASEDRPWDGSK